MDELSLLFYPKMKEKDVLQMNILSLAFIGDGVHTLYVRDGAVKSSDLLAKSYHTICAKKCNALAQSLVLEKIYSFLDEKERDVIRRAKNAKMHHSSKNFDEETYKKATAFEALVGYLYLLGKYDRIKLLLTNGEKQ